MLFVLLFSFPIFLHLSSLMKIIPDMRSAY